MILKQDENIFLQYSSTKNKHQILFVSNFTFLKELY